MRGGPGRRFMRLSGLSPFGLAAKRGVAQRPIRRGRALSPDARAATHDALRGASTPPRAPTSSPPASR